LSELREPLDRLVPIGAIFDAGGSDGLVVLRGELSGLEAVVLVFVCVLSDEKREKVADRGEGDSAVLDSPRERCSRRRRSWSLDEGCAWPAPNSVAKRSKVAVGDVLAAEILPLPMTPAVCGPARGVKSVSLIPTRPSKEAEPRRKRLRRAA
jgi:hypothetical protein